MGKMWTWVSLHDWMAGLQNGARVHTRYIIDIRSAMHLFIGVFVGYKHGERYGSKTGCHRF